MLLNLFNELCTHRANTTNKDIEYLILAKEEGVVQHIHGLSELLLRNNKGDIGLFRTLCKGYHADTIAALCAEEFASNTWHILHLLAYDADGG